MQQLDDPKLLFVDLFCGAGGVTTAIEHAKVFDKKVARVLSCVNHDKNAIATHQANHPHCEHFTEDIRSLNVSKLVRGAQEAKHMYPNARLCLWASLECTHFSKARGGLARDADSRTLAEHLYRYIEAFIMAGIPFEAIFIENVEEFMSWGPLNADGKPVSKDKGKDYEKWRDHIKGYGFRYDYRILNCADFGDYTSRKRYFGQFVNSSLDITWPQPTHSRKGIGLPTWKPVREVLDLDIMGDNIFERKRGPLVEATLERIYNGLTKHFPEREAFIDYQYGSGYSSSLDTAAGTVTAKNKMNLVQFVPNGFLDYYYGHGFSTSLNVPAGTVTTKDRMNLVHFLLFPQWGPKCSHSIHKPSPVLPARMDKMYPYYIHGDVGQSSVVINESDSKYTKLIKQFMIDNGISEVRFRPLSIPELLRITGLDNYKMVGSLAEQKKYIGNAVPVQIGKAMITSFAQALPNSNSGSIKFVA